jgi:SMI1-KNR4 cell-wall
MQELDWNEVRARTLALSARQGLSTSAGNVLPEVLTEAQVGQAEEQFGIVFPDEYRQYLLNVSAGGRIRTLRHDRSG